MISADKVVGCIVGGAIGDGYGGPFEGQVKPVVAGRQIWRLSDDTQMTLATCEALIDTRGIIDPAQIAVSFAAWFRASKITGMGASTYKALSELAHGAHWALVGAKGDRAAGNGAAMRIAPLGFLGDPTNPKHRERIRDVSRITHHNEEAYVGALAIAAAIAFASDGSWPGDDSLLSLINPVLPDTQVRDRIRSLLGQNSKMSIHDVARQYGCSGYVVESVPLALYGAQQASICEFEKTLQHLATAGGDTDSICSMAGQVIGTWLGYGRIPSALLGRLPDRTIIEQTANRLSSVITDG